MMMLFHLDQLVQTPVMKIIQLDTVLILLRKQCGNFGINMSIDLLLVENKRRVGVVVVFSLIVVVLGSAVDLGEVLLIVMMG